MKLIKFINAICQFFDNIENSIGNSWLMLMLFAAFWTVVLLGTVVYIIHNPTLETAYIIGGLIVARVVYAGLTGK